MRRVLGSVGRALVTVGLLLLLFVAYQLWGTGIYTAQAQNELQEQFEQAQRQASTTTTDVADRHHGSVDRRPRRPDHHASAPVRRAARGRRRSAASASRRSGSTRSWSRASTSTTCGRARATTRAPRCPGHEGNSAIAGHRTTYEAPFGDLDQLAPGDEIRVVTVQGDFHYKVTEQARGRPEPDRGARPDARPGAPRPPARDPHAHHLQPEVLGRAAPHHQGRSSSSRRGRLPLPPDRRSTEGTTGHHHRRPVGRVVVAHADDPLGAITLAIGLLWWLLFHRHPRWTTWFVGVVPFLVVLFVAYTYLERLLPSNY